MTATSLPRLLIRVPKVAIVERLECTYSYQQDGLHIPVHPLVVVNSISEVELRVLPDIHCEPSSSPFQILSYLRRKNHQCTLAIKRVHPR